MLETIDSKQPESFGLIKFSRVDTGGLTAPLFGQEVRSHSYIELTIQKNALAEDSKLGRHYTPSGYRADEVVTVAMSESQFASLISNFNRGDGTPCTLLKLSGQNVEQPTIDELPGNMVSMQRGIIERELQSSVNEVKNLRKKLEELTTGKVLSKARKDELLSEVRHLECILSDNVPFHVKQAGDCINKITDRAKDELLAIISHSPQLSDSESSTFGKLTN